MKSRLPDRVGFFVYTSKCCTESIPKYVWLQNRKINFGWIFPDIECRDLIVSITAVASLPFAIGVVAVVTGETCGCTQINRMARTARGISMIHTCTAFIGYGRV